MKTIRIVSKAIGLVMIMFALFGIDIATAQTDKNSLSLGIGFDLGYEKNALNSQSSTDNSTRTAMGFGISPYAGFFVVKNFEIGAGYTYRNNTQDMQIHDEYSTGSNNTEYHYSNIQHIMGLYAKYHFPIVKQFGLFSEVYGNYGFGKAKSNENYNTYVGASFFPTIINMTQSSKETAVGLSLGAEVFIKKHIGFELKMVLAEYYHYAIDRRQLIEGPYYSGGVLYTNSTVTESTTKTSTMTFVPTPSLRFGIKYNFGFKRKTPVI